MSHSRTHAQIEAEKQAASGLAKMGLVDPSLRKKEHGPKAVAKKAQRLYNSVVHGVADKKVEQQETSNMTQSLAVSSYAIDARRLHLPMKWVVSLSILSRFGAFRGPEALARRVDSLMIMKTASPRPRQVQVDFTH